MIRRVALVLVAAFLMKDLAIGQEIIAFHPWRHLEAWEECAESDYADLYDFAPFDKLQKSPLTEEELADVRARWEVERKRVALLIDAIEKDPHEKAVRSLLERVADHGYLSKIDYTRVDDYAPFVFFVQRPPKDNPEYAASIADFYGPWLRELESILVSEFVEPLELERRKDTPYAVFVLASRGAYGDFADALGLEGIYGMRAHYDPRLQFAVTYRDAFGRQQDRTQTERHAALHEFVHAVQHAHYVDDDELPENPWLTEGIAEYLATHDQVMPGVLREHLSDKNALETVLGFSTNPSVSKAVLFPLQELLVLPDYGSIIRAAFERAQALGGIRHDYSALALPAFYAQSGLWIHFLRHGEGGRYREKFDLFFGRVQ